MSDEGQEAGGKHGSAIAATRSITAFGYDDNDHRAHLRRLDQQESRQAQGEDLLTGRPTLGIPRLCHNA